jgi:hypothetical protein
VLKAIQSGTVSMRPKWHFAVSTAFLIAGIVLAALAAIYLASFILFILRDTGVLFVPGFGLVGLGAFFWSLPWLMIAMAAVFLILLHILIRRYAFSYGRPLFYSAMSIVGFVVVGGVVLAKTSLHPELSGRAEQHRLVLGQGLYQDYGHRPPKHVHLGLVTAVVDVGYHMQGRFNDQLTIILTPKTRFPFGKHIVVGDMILVVGERQEHSITAIGIRTISEDMLPPRRGRLPR